jgi:hypothetical protein
VYASKNYSAFLYNNQDRYRIRQLNDLHNITGRNGIGVKFMLVNSEAILTASVNILCTAACIVNKT